MNYDNIAAALSFYQSKGYVYVHDAPWLVGKHAYDATKPANAVDVEVKIKGQPEYFHVASGEQSFIQMLLNGREFKRACCVTPCFRMEPMTEWNKRNFIKCELINTDDVSASYLIHMIHDAMTFFELQGLETRIIETGYSSYDIVEKHLRMELGSYGIRSMQHPDPTKAKIEWIYGTGCAEPRLSSVQRELRYR